ncbi:uncharacterized protein LOC141673595 [Apium graveolens]|uniref:uncharacterized protein LOC141673595 n=1 Tax=Apium graveolens TaxID=4045 RepID=UPI003D797923
MSFPSEVYFNNSVNRPLQEETSYDKEELKILHEKNHGMLNPEQKNVYDSIIQNVYNKVGGVFFVYGSGGCGKTFLWQTLCCRLRSEGKIVLHVASCGIAAVLLPGGRTAHSRFHIPLKLDQDSIAGIRHGTDIVELIQQTDLIIWDEAPMQHCHAFESVDHFLRDIMSAIDKRRAKKPFGGITIVFGGDYRQILHMIPKASRAEVVGSTLNKSKIWEFFQVFLLKKNMRLHAENTEMENKVIVDFSKWQLLVGDGKVKNFSPDADTAEMLIKIPDQYVVHTTQNLIESLFEITYPDFVRNMSSHSYLRSRSILTLTNIVVDDINNNILEKIPGTLHTYLSQDSIDDVGDEDNEFRSAFPVEYLNSLNMPCIPKHELNIKVGVIVMLMRNLNQIIGLCNGTRMIVASCKKNSIECEVLCGSHAGSKHLIPRTEMISTDTSWPFEFKRIQFPLQIYYAMTINKCQGQSLDTVGLYLPRAVFFHGHVYVAISRVTKPEGLHILIDSDDGTTTNITSNVVYEEVFYNLPSINDENVSD